MPETLAQFHARVDGFQHDSLSHDGWLVTKPLLVEKVGPDGRLLPFYGNTMIFDLPAETKLAIARMQLTLHHRCGHFLAHPLTPDTLHMTLHDLLNGVNADELSEPVKKTGWKARTLLTRMREEALPPVHLTSTAAFNMVNGSVCLGFAPDTEADCAVLMDMHARFQDIVALDYPLTPHVTLAYYQPGAHGPDRVAALSQALHEINTLPPVRLTVDANCLHYCLFTSMNHYLQV